MSASNGVTPAAADTLPRGRVVLVPCSAGVAGQYRALAAQLGGFDVVPIELLGHGAHRRWDGAGPLRLADESAAIAAVCPDGPPFHLVGHSYGGAVALRFALGFPHRLRSLTLIEPSCFHILKRREGIDANLLGEIRAVADAVNRGVISGDYRAGMEVFIDYWCGAGTWRRLPAARRDRLAQLAVAVAHHFWNLIEEDGASAAYGGLDVPTLILCGTRSPIPARAITRILADKLPRVRHRTLRDAGHMSPMTHPQAVAPLIVEHLRCTDAPLAGTPAGAIAATDAARPI